MLKRRFKLLLKVLLGTMLLFFLLLLVERIRGQVLLARYKRELVARGEKLSPQDLVAHFQLGDNGAPEVFRGIDELKEGAAVPKSYPPKMRLTPSGHAVVGFHETAWVDERVTNDWKGVAADLKTNETTLARIRAALDKPVLNNELDFSQGFKMKFPRLASAKSLVNWFGAGSQLALHNGKPHQAVDDLVHEIRLPRLLAEDRIAISELVRIAIAAVGKAAVWEALQADGWTDEDLAKIQEAVQSQEFASAMARSLEGERIYNDVTHDSLRQSNDDTYDLLGWAKVFNLRDDEQNSFSKSFPGMEHFFDKQIYCRVWRFAWSHQDQRRDLEQQQRLIEIARLAAQDKSRLSVQRAIEKLAAESRQRNWYDRLRYPNPELTLIKVIDRALHAETDRSLSLCAIALKRYSLRHGNFPDSLVALVPDFLASVPTDYMDGRPLKYRRNEDGSFILYSAGEDGKDDGGDGSLPPGKEKSTNPWARKDFIWPSPATPEEVLAWRKTAGKY